MNNILYRNKSGKKSGINETLQRIEREQTQNASGKSQIKARELELELELELEQEQDASATNQYGQQLLQALHFLGPALHTTFTLHVHSDKILYHLIIKFLGK